MLNQEGRRELRGIAASVPFKERRLLPLWTGRGFFPMPVDDQGSCTNQHILNFGRYHRYEDKEGRLFAVLCPERLSFDERHNSVNDTPPGSWEEKLSARKYERLQQDARRRLAEKQEKRQWGGSS